ncbi:MAG: LysR family transcriptional regulator [Proteobacteria bacterium]|nr:MAG: LysR family transcriptional regulator [Pseudomonadota bacterium]
MLPLRHLRIVNAVIVSGGVRAASDTLLRAASAVSRSVSLLEAAIGLPLFERKGRGMLATAAGELVQNRFARLDVELREVLADAQATDAVTRHGPLTATALDVLCDERWLLTASLLAELHHMPTVGVRLGVSQPAISAAVNRLETALQHRLFARTARGLLPTDLGARWLPRFDRALNELRYLHDDLAALRGFVQGTVIVGALPLARTRVLPLAIAALHARHPQLRVQSVESPYEQLRTDLMHGKIDFIIGALRPNPDPVLQTESLFAEPLGIIAAASHPLQACTHLSISELRRQSWVLSRLGSPLRTALNEYFLRFGESPPVPVVETGDLAMVRGLLLDGGMITVLSSHQLRYELEAGQVRLLPVDMSGLQREIGITTRRHANLPASVQALLSEIRSVVKSTIDAR